MKDFRGMKRQRSRNRKPSGNQTNNPNRAYESNGPDGAKVRGNAQTIYEKYQQLARDANSSGDRVLAENYLQHAEHYFRLIRQMQPQRPVSEFLQRDPFSTGFDYDEELDGYPSDNGDNGQETESSSEAEAPEDQARFDTRRDRNDRNERNRERDRNDRNRDNRDNRDRDNNRDNRDRDNRDRDNRDRDNRQVAVEREPRPVNDRPASDRAAPERIETDAEGNRRESRRERYERRRMQRLSEQEVVVNGSGHVASTEPLSASSAPVAEVAGLETITPEATPMRAPRPPRAPRVEPEAASHLPAFLRAPVTTAAPEGVADEAPASDEAPKRGRPRRKKADEAVVGADEA